MIGLGVEELGCRRDLGRDLRLAGGAERGLIGIARGQRRSMLRLGGRVDRRAVCRADIVALAHALRGIVIFPEDLQEPRIGDLVRVEHDHHRLGVARQAGAGLLIGRVGRQSALVADGGDEHARRLPEEALRPPEAAHPEIGDLEPVGKGALERPLAHVMTRGGGDRGLAAGQLLALARQLQLLVQDVAEEEHVTCPILGARVTRVR